MSLHVCPARDAEIAASREDYSRAVNAQIVHWSWLERGFAEAYAIIEARGAGGGESLEHGGDGAAIRGNGRIIGHALVGGAPAEPRDALAEFHVAPEHLHHGLAALRAVVKVSGATRILAQSNDASLLLALHDVCLGVRARSVLFEDPHERGLRGLMPPLPEPCSGVLFRPLDPRERAKVFAHESEPVGDWCVTVDRTIVATGGFFTHYNPPYADIYMEVAPAWRRKGIGSYLVSRLLGIVRKRDLLPAARCNIANAASRACLTRGGLIPCGHLLEGTIATQCAARA